MSIATEIQKLKSNIANAYTSVGTKGGTVPDNQNTDNLSEAIESIPTGTPLPELTDPATPSDVMRFKEFIDQNGEKQIGNPIIDHYGPWFSGTNLNGDTNPYDYNHYVMHNAPDCNMRYVSIFHGTLVLDYIRRLTGAINLDAGNIGRVFDMVVLNGKVAPSNITATWGAPTYLNATIDLSSATSVSLSCKNTVFVENTCKANFTRSGANLDTTDEIINNANALKDAITGKKISLHANTKALCNGIYGNSIDKTRGTSSNADLDVTVDTETYKSAVSGIYGDYVYTYNGADWVDGSSSVIDLLSYGITLDGTPTTNDTLTVELYHYFTADESGDASLTEFITIIKGWTLA